MKKIFLYNNTLINRCLIQIMITLAYQSKQAYKITFSMNVKIKLKDKILKKMKVLVNKITINSKDKKCFILNH